MWSAGKKRGLFAAAGGNRHFTRESRRADIDQVHSRPPFSRLRGSTQNVAYMLCAHSPNIYIRRLALQLCTKSAHFKPKRTKAHTNERTARLYQNDLFFFFCKNPKTYFDYYKAVVVVVTERMNKIQVYFVASTLLFGRFFCDTSIVQVLTPTGNTTVSTLYGQSIMGNDLSTLIIGSRSEGGGAVYVNALSGSSYYQTQRIVSPNSADLNFGMGVAIGSNHAAVTGARFPDIYLPFHFL